MPESIPVSAEAVAELPHPDDETTEIAAGVAYRRLVMVNVVFVGNPGCGDGRWVLVRTLVAGDAFVTTNQESVYSILTQALQLHGPPAFMTPDWPAAQRSVETLAALDPEVVVTGHGRAMQGPEMRAALHKLARDFTTMAVPENRR